MLAVLVILSTSPLPEVVSMTSKMEPESSTGLAVSLEEGDRGFGFFRG